GCWFRCAAGVFVLAAAGGVLVGLAVAWLVNRLLRRLVDAVVENTLMLLAPFLAFVPAEAVHASGVLAVVVAGLLIGHRLPREATYASRLQAEFVWEMVDFLLEAVVFVLIGLQLGNVLHRLQRWAPVAVARWAALRCA